MYEYNFSSVISSVIASLFISSADGKSSAD